MAGTIAVTEEKIAKGLSKVVFTCVGDASDGSFPADQSSQAINGEVLMVKTIPGATNPTADWDIKLNDSDGCDILGAEGTDRSASLAEQILPKIGSHYGKRPVDGALTPVITGNAVHSANIVVEAFIRRPA